MGALKQWSMPLPRRVSLAIQIVEPTTIPKTVGVVNPELITINIERHRIGGVRLQLDCVRSRVGRGVHNLHRPFERLVVVARHLGDHHRRFVRTDNMITDLNAFRYHRVTRGFCETCPLIRASSGCLERTARTSSV